MIVKPAEKKREWAFTVPGTTGAFVLQGKRMLANDVILPGEYNPHNVKPWVIGHEFGPIALVWASNVQDALDEAVDANLMESMRVPQKDYEAMTPEEQEELALLGNAGEPFYQQYLWVGTVNRKDSPELMFEFAMAREAGEDTL
jgi:hypothetical protein